MVNMRKARARQVLRPLHRWRRVASRHGLVLSRSDFTSFHGGLCVDSMPVAEWIVAVCGCWEDGGTIDQCTDEAVSVRSPFADNVRYDDTVHAVGSCGLPLCGNAMMPACAPEPTSDEVTCWECKAITD